MPIVIKKKKKPPPQKKVFKIVTGKRKALLLRGFSTSYCQFLPHSLLRGRGKKGPLERALLASKLAKPVRSEHKRLYEKLSNNRLDNRTLVFYFVLLILPSVIVDTLLDKGKVVEKFF